MFESWSVCLVLRRFTVTPGDQLVKEIVTPCTSTSCIFRGVCNYQAGFLRTIITILRAVRLEN